MLNLKFAPHLKLLLLNDNLYDYAFKKSYWSYNELNAKNINVISLGQAFVYSYTEQGTLFWEQKQLEYEQAKFKTVLADDLISGKWYADVEDMDELTPLKFIEIKEGFIIFDTLPEHKVGYKLNSETGLIQFTYYKNFNLENYEFKK